MLISVILPVYNGESFLADSISSILNQSFSDFELIIINDGSTDKSEEVIKLFKDPRIRYFSQSNHGLAATLNFGIGLALGKYIARQDQDDVSFFRRLEKQAEFLENNPEVSMLGTAAQVWDKNQKTRKIMRHPSSDCGVKFSFLFDNFFVHSSVMVRRDILIAEKGYSTDITRQPPEDFELWSRIVRKYKVANLPESHIAYRELPTSMSRVNEKPFLKNVLKISTENISNLFDSKVDCVAVSDLTRIIHFSYSDLSGQNNFFKLLKLISHVERVFASRYRYSIYLIYLCSWKFKLKLLIGYIRYSLFCASKKI